MSLRLRLVLILAPLFVVGLVVADVFTYASLQSSLISRLDQQIFAAHDNAEDAMLARAIEGSRGFGGGGPGGGPGGGGGGPGSLPPTTWVGVISPTGTVANHPYAFNDQADNAGTPLLPATLTPGTPGHPNYQTVGGSGGVNSYRIFVDTAQHVVNGTLVVAVPMDDVNNTLRDLLLLQVGLGGGVTVLLLVATWYMVRRGLRPLERMGETARSAAGDLSLRVTPSSENTEVGQLGVAINSMLAQLEAAFTERARNEQRLRHFISDASHELRTPLTSMQGYAELLRRNPEMEGEDLRLAMRRMEDETRRMGVLVDDLLLLARLDQGRPLESSRVDLEALVADAVADARAAEPERAISARIAAPLVVTGDDMRLRQVLGNIVRNALVHTPAGTPVEVALRGEDGRAVIDVVDHGGGVPEGHRERIFERFHRADPGRSGDQGGSGLGLSIAAAVVAAHGGSIRVLDTAGGGATFRIELPLPQPGLTGDSKPNQGPALSLDGDPGPAHPAPGMSTH